MRRAVAMLVVLMSAALWGVGAWRSLTATRRSAPCASSSAVARSSSLSPGCGTGAKGARERVRRVRHWVLDARDVAHRVASFGYPVGPRGAVAPLCMEFSGDADGARGVEALERLCGCARRNSTSPRAGEITTERRPAATSPAALAWLTTPRWSPIWVAATMTVREVA